MDFCFFKVGLLLYILGDIDSDNERESVGFVCLVGNE